MDKLGKTPPASEITPEPLYLHRREFIRNALLFTVTSTGVGRSLLWLMGGNRASEPKSSPASVSAPPLTSEVHCLHLSLRPRANARAAQKHSRLALCRGAPHRRSGASPDHPGGRTLWQGAPQSEWGTAPSGRAVEVRL